MSFGFIALALDWYCVEGIFMLVQLQLNPMTKIKGNARGTGARMTLLVKYDLSLFLFLFSEGELKAQSKTSTR
jgi:hypothetical protein